MHADVSVNIKGGVSARGNFSNEPTKLLTFHFNSPTENLDAGNKRDLRQLHVRISRLKFYLYPLWMLSRRLSNANVVGINSNLSNSARGALPFLHTNGASQQEQRHKVGGKRFKRNSSICVIFRVSLGKLLDAEWKATLKSCILGIAVNSILDNCATA